MIASLNHHSVTAAEYPRTPPTMREPCDSCAGPLGSSAVRTMVVGALSGLAALALVACSSGTSNDSERSSPSGGATASTTSVPARYGARVVRQVVVDPVYRQG